MNNKKLFFSLIIKFSYMYVKSLIFFNRSIFFEFIKLNSVAQNLCFPKILLAFLKFFSNILLFIQPYPFLTDIALFYILKPTFVSVTCCFHFLFIQFFSLTFRLYLKIMTKVSSIFIWTSCFLFLVHFSLFENKSFLI